MVGEDTAVELAEAAAEQGAGAALLIAKAGGQPRLDADAIAGRVEPLGVIVVAPTSVAGLLRALAAYSARTPKQFAAALPCAMAGRIR